MSQIKRKFIENNAVNGAKFRLDNNEALRARNGGDTADVDMLRLTAADVFEIMREISMTGNRITDLQDPIDPQDAATRAFVEATAAGISDPKDPVNLATLAPLPANVYDNGAAGIGATLTGAANGALVSIDGVPVTLGMRVLVKNEVNGAHNGIFDVTDLGSAGTPYVLTRSTDADGSPANEVSYGMFTSVVAGSLNGQQSFFLATPNPITLGTSILTFSRFAEVIIASDGLVKVGSTLSVDNGNGLTFSGGQLIARLDSALLSLGTQKFNGAGEIVGLRDFKEVFTLAAGDITNGYVDLTKVAHQGSVDLVPVGGPPQREGSDYAMNYTGGTSSKSRVTFQGDLTGAAALVAGDIVEVKFRSLDY